jgi:UDP-D-galactose:(glucosyl)LPS alpha-1,3-D-galactosyltransferase
MKPHAVDDAIHVLLTADRHYIVPALVTAASLLSSHRGAEPVVIHFASDQEDGEVERLFEALVARRRNASVVFHCIDLDCFAPGQPMPYGTGSYMTFARLLCGRFVPPDVSRLLYLDTDMLCMRDVAELFRAPASGRAVSMAPGHYLDRACPWDACVPFAPREPGESGVVFSAGLMLLDLDAWRCRTDEMLGVFAERHRELPHLDQSVINYVWRREIEPLPRKWNHWAGAADARPDEVLHFIGRVKPWSPRVGMSGPVVLWWAVYEHQIRPLLPAALQKSAPPEWRTWAQVPLRDRLALAPPRLVNWAIGMIRPGRRSAERRRGDLDYLRSKQARVRQRLMWAQAIRRAAGG